MVAIGLHSDRLSSQDLRKLAQPRHSPCVALYMPTHRAGSETQQDPIRLRKLLDQAQQQLTQDGMRAPLARELLAPARPLLDEPEFWRHQSDGLALFLAEGELQRFRVQLRLDERIIVGARFHLKPLFALLGGDGLFCILAISQNDLRLLRCTRDNVEEIESDQLPRSEDVILRYVDAEKQLQFHTQTSPQSGTRSAVFHGHGTVESDYKQRIFEYFRLAADAVHRVIDVPLNEGAPPPVVFAGVEFLFPIFQQANRKLNLLPQFVRGNADGPRVGAEKLHEKAWAIASAYFDRERDKAIEMYAAMRGAQPERASDELPEIVRAAHDGRVATVLADTRAECWGRFDPTTGIVEPHDSQQRGDDDLIDFACVQTFLHGGRVMAVDSSTIDGKPVAAVLRY